MEFGTELDATTRQGTAVLDEAFVLNFDCGDGVPALETMPRLDTDRVGLVVGAGGRRIGARLFGLGATVVGQLLIALAVLAGGSAVVGITAAAMLLLCGLAFALAEVVNRRLP